MMNFLSFLLLLLSSGMAATPASLAVSSAVSIHGSPHIWGTEILAGVIRDVGFDESVKNAILEQKITGDILSQYDDDAELLSIHITSFPDRKRLGLLVKAMASHSSGPIYKGGEMPPVPSSAHDLMELRKLNPKGFTLDLLLISFNTRLALWLFKEEGLTGKPNALQLFDGHPQSAQYSAFWWWAFPEMMTINHWEGFTDTNFFIANGLKFTSLLSGFTVFFNSLPLVTFFFFPVSRESKESFVDAIVYQGIIIFTPLFLYFCVWLLWPIIPGLV